MKNSTIYEQFQNALELHGYSRQTIPGYVRGLSGLVWYYQRLPEEITGGELRQYLLHLVFECKLPRNAIIRTIAALRAFFRYVLQRPEAAIKDMLPSLFMPRTYPEIYSPEEIEHILTAKGLRIDHQMMLMMLYATGIREDEACRLKVSDIQSWRMQIRVEQSGDKKERRTVLSPQLLNYLRNYWRIFRPSTWLFPSSHDSSKAVHPITFVRAFHRALKLSGLPLRGGISSLRHSFAVHMLESGVDLQTLQSYLGHRWIVSTTIYVYLMRRGLSEMKSPLGLIEIHQLTTDNREAV